MTNDNQNDKQVNKLWQKLPKIPIDTKLNLKTMFVWEKKKYIKKEICDLSWSNVARSVGSIFVQLTAY